MKNTLRQKYEQYGYAIAPQLLTPSNISSFTTLIDPIFQQWYQKNQEALMTDQLINMHSLTHPRYFEGNQHRGARVQLFEQIAAPVLTDLLKDMFGSGLHFHNTQLFFNPNSPEKQPYWHRDMQYSPIKDKDLAAAQAQMVSLHVRIPLVPETGVALIPGTHQRWDTELERDVRLELNGHRNFESLPNAKLITLKPGDVLIFSANMIHRGNYSLDTHRKALDLCIGTAHPFTTPYLNPEVLPTPDELESITHADWYAQALAIANHAAT